MSGVDNRVSRALSFYVLSAGKIRNGFYNLLTSGISEMMGMFLSMLSATYLMVITSNIISAVLIMHIV